MRHLLCFALLLALTVTDASADPYWIAYEGNDFPENVGWNRHYGNWDGQWHGGANRSIQDGILTIDSLYDSGVFDFAWIEMPGQIDPDPGERFVVEWGLNVSAVVGRVDPEIALTSDDEWAVGFEYDEDTVFSVFEDDVSAEFTPSVFHGYRLISLDMREYELYIDGQLVIEGHFWQGVVQSFVAWGDGVQGAASVSQWDYFRFGVVPEPSMLLMTGGLCVFAGVERKRPTDTRNRKERQQ